MTLRIRCEVLRTLANIGPTDSKAVLKNLPDLKPEQVQKAIYRLLTQDRIEKIGVNEREGKTGRPLFVYKVRDEWEPANKTKEKKGRKTYKEELRSSRKSESDSMPTVINYRDRKIRLLQKLLNIVSGTEKDLIYGILADYGYK